MISHPHTKGQHDHAAEQIAGTKFYSRLALRDFKHYSAHAHADEHIDIKGKVKYMAKAKVKVVEEEEVELDELDEDVEEEEAPTRSKSKAAKEPEITFGVRDLCEHLSKVMGKVITPKDLRTQIRRMAREDNPRIDREVVAGNRSRYDWPNGLKDPEVKAIIAAVTGGELEEGKKAALAKLKEDKAAKKAAKGDGKGKGKKSKKAVVVEDDDDEEDEDDE
jgi:hypothetical protein